MLNPTTLTNDELHARVRELQDAGMFMAAKAVMRELNFREKRAA
jgi:hypothetical protein